MKHVSAELIAQVKTQVNALKPAYDTEVVNEIICCHSIAKPVIERIPRLIAQAFINDRSYEEVCEVCDYEGAARSPQFAGDRLFFLNKSDYEWLSMDGSAPKPSWLIGAAGLVYRYCEENSLRPTLMPHRTVDVTTGQRHESWYSSKLVIRWAREPISHLLGKLPERWECF